MRPSLLARLRRDRRGASAIEFAIIAPVMIACWFGLVETGAAITAGRRTNHAAAALADLVAQKSQMSAADVDDSFQAATQMMNPMDTAPLKLKVTSVTRDASGRNLVDWSEGKGLTKDTPGAVVSDIPAGVLVDPGDSVVVGRAEYAFKPASAQVVAVGLTYKDVSYMKPRTGKVTRTT